MGDEVQNISIQSLPNEVISIILLNNGCRDILSFSATCKDFNEIVINDHYLWMEKFKAIVPKDVFQIVQSHCNDGNWLNEVKGFHVLKNKVYFELISMSPKFYWHAAEISLQDLNNFFTLALSNNMSYYYTVQILHDIIKTTNRNINEYKGETPYTLTEMYYAKIALSQLIHLYLSVKWVQKHNKAELYPDIVLNFFTQWTDIDKIHGDEDVDGMITSLSNKVEITLTKQQSPNATPELSIREKCARGLIKEKKVLAAITDVIYNQERVTVTAAANIDTLDIIKVLKNKCGNVVSVAAIYHAVARMFGVKCDVIAFPNHFFLEWRDTKSIPNAHVFRIDLATGALQPKQSCPFAENSDGSSYRYSPEFLLQYVFSSFIVSMGAIDNWYTKNASSLLEFLHTDELYNNPFKNFQRYLCNDTPLNTLPPINLKYLQNEHMHLIDKLSQLNTRSGEPRCRDFVIKQRDHRVKYAVGMICNHKKYEYVCIIRGWEPSCHINWRQRPEIKSLQFGAKQPFYDVFAADQSKRYVAQENLIEVTHPHRLYHLEDMIAREFTHFNGYAYEPNNEKKSEYPDDDPIRVMFHKRASVREELGSEFDSNC